MEFLNSFSQISIDTIKVILVLGFLIFIHELGHFLVAKKVGIKVHEFALGFGTKLFWFKRGETVYSIRLLPLGGFVKMEGEEEHSEDDRAFNKKTIGQRMAVVFAGPLTNIIFALIILFCMNMVGGRYVSSVIGQVMPASNAKVVGLAPGDKIIKINNKTIRLKEEINWFMNYSNGEPVKVTILRNNARKDLVIKPYLMLNFEADANNKVTQIYEGTGLDRLGLKTGDKIARVNNILVKSPVELLKVIDQNKQNNMVFSIDRAGKVSDKNFSKLLVRRYLIGFTTTEVSGDIKGLVYNSFWKSIFLMRTMLIEIGNLFTGGIAIDNLMGPIGIAKEISSTRFSDALLRLAAFISLNLGIVNLIPFPPLDGSKILTLTIEAVRRRPLKQENEVLINLLGFSILIMLMIFVTFNEAGRTWFGR
jgi:regulator of sigma E protease